ncbi:16669_t:CDS:2 [Funneliformis mosseae]|uniref:16669_t:CDS:1 n=1 Tax=Funneliformis mosseae TaxID=27381 RepID=A0A9N8VAD6_FUNMO|nr:16669_t:CDS:2 [Funneliformis mosseae]
MKFSATILLIVALLASIGFSTPSEYKKDEFYKYCQNIEFKKPVDGIMYMINSTQVADFVVPKDCMKKYGYYLMTTVEIFSIGANKIIDTIVEQEYYYHVQSESGMFIAKDEK